MQNAEFRIQNAFRITAKLPRPSLRSPAGPPPC
jgi:hypothetical protein